MNQINELVKHIEDLTEELNIADEIIENLLEEDTGLYEEEKKKWIQNALKEKTKGALHKSLHVKSDKNIPVSKLEKASHKPGKMGKRARLALTLRKLSKK
jgi:hypothetical protein